MVDTRNGLFGLSVAGHVMEELKIVIVPAPTPNLQTEEETATDWDELKMHGHVTYIRAQLMEASQTGLPGLCVLSHLAMELNGEIDRAPIHPLQTVENNAKALLRKHAYVPLKCIWHQSLKGFQTGLPGLSVVPHVVMAFNSVTDHVPIHLLQTMEQLAGVLQTNHEHAPLKTVTL